MLKNNLLSWFTVLYEFVQKYPVVQGLLLGVLALLTVFRKKLSSNNEYRRRPSTIKQVTKKHHSNHTKVGKGKGHVSFTKFSTEVMVHIVSYMTNHEIACLMTTSKRMYREISMDAIWEQLWLQTYGAMWQHPEIRKIREGRGIYWDPLLNYGPPQQGWYRFFLLFEVSYIDWILAGYCSHDRCLVGIRNSIVDVTNFIDVHPGSRETLTEGAGCDATETFDEIGHSTHAEHLLSSMKIWDCSSSNVPACLCNNAHLLQNLCGYCLQTKRNKGNKRQIYAITCQKRRFPVTTKLHEHMKVNQKKVTELARSKHQQAASDAATAEAGEEGHFSGFSNVLPLIEAAASSASDALNSATGAVSSAVSSAGIHVPLPSLTATPTAASTSVMDGEDGEVGEGYFDGSSTYQLFDNDTDSADSDSIAGNVDDESEVSSEASSGVYSDDVGDDVIDVDDMPELAHGLGSVVYSPASALTSILDKIKREYRKGSLQLRNASWSSTSRQQADASKGEEGGEDEGPAPPIASYFAPSQRMVPELGGFFECVNPQDHMGQPKAFFDPFTEEWTAWWSCCGYGHVLIEAPMPPEDPMRDAIFCK